MYVDSLNCLMWVLGQNLSKWPKVSEQLVKEVALGSRLLGSKVCAHGHVRYCRKIEIEEKASSRSLDAHSRPWTSRLAATVEFEEEAGVIIV